MESSSVSPGDPTVIAAVLDWEMGAIGDPRADLGYLVATYTEPGGAQNPLGTSPVTATPCSVRSMAAGCAEFIWTAGRIPKTPI